MSIEQQAYQGPDICKFRQPCIDVVRHLGSIRVSTELAAIVDARLETASEGEQASLRARHADYLADIALEQQAIAFDHPHPESLCGSSCPIICDERRQTQIAIEEMAFGSTEPGIIDVPLPRQEDTLHTLLNEQ